MIKLLIDCLLFQRLPRVVGPAIARELIYTARILSGAQAEKIGININVDIRLETRKSTS